MEGQDKEAKQDWDGAIEAYRAAGDNDEMPGRIETCLYQKAVSLCQKIKDDGATAEQAIDALTAIHDRDLFDRARTFFAAENAFYDIWAAEFSTGCTIELGTYEQDLDPADGPEPISWKIICSKDGKALLLSEKVIDAMPFMSGKLRSELNDMNTDEVWQHSDIYRWTKEELIKGFADQETVLLTETESGELFFILDNKEYKQYCSEEESSSLTATPYALSRDESHHDLRYYKKDSDGTRVPGNAVIWWIRTGAVKEEGYLYPDDLSMIAGVRPAVWISYEQGPSQDWIDSHYPLPETEKK